jgi:hypothetical protein
LQRSRSLWAISFVQPGEADPDQSMNTRLAKLVTCSILSCFLKSGALAQTASPADARPRREVRDQTIISKELPAGKLIISKDFEYIGGQRINLYGNADAEQHLFVKKGANGSVDRFYWVQFEQFFPTNAYTYDYPADHATDVGGLKFVYDVKTWPDYASLLPEDPASDGAAVARLLAQHDLHFPKRAVRIRMFHLPTSDRRTELMIIYGEALLESSKVPVRLGGVDLDKESPDSARAFVENARRDLAFRKP